MTLTRSKTEELGLRGKWKNITTELDASVWNSSSSTKYDGMLFGIELMHNTTHIGVVFPDGRFRPAKSQTAYEDPSEEAVTVSTHGEKYALAYVSLGKTDKHPSFMVFQAQSGCSCAHCLEDGFEYCPHCGGELP